MKNLTPVLVIGGVLLLFLFLRKKPLAGYAQAQGPSYPAAPAYAAQPSSPIGTALSMPVSAFTASASQAASAAGKIAKIGIQTAAFVPVETTKAGIGVVKSVGGAVVSTGSSIIHGIGSLF